MAELTHSNDSEVRGGPRHAFPILAHANAANLITSTSIALGIAAALLAFEGHLLPAFILAPITIVCDTLDGYVARRTGTSSPFGAQLDSLADALSFGVLPAMLGYSLGMKGPLTLLLIWYALCACWRLARFNLVGMRTNAAGVECFEGFPTTFMGGMLYIITPIVIRIPHPASTALLSAYFLVGGLLMNSGLLIPKRSRATRVLLLLGPIATAATCLHLL